MQPPTSDLKPLDDVAPAAGRVPTTVTVLSVIGISVGALGLLCKPVGLLGMLVQSPRPVLEVIRNDPFIRGWTVITVGTGWLVSLLLLLSSAGSLKLRDWGRWGVLAYAVLAIGSTLVERTVEYRVIAPAMAPAIRQAIAEQPAAGAAAAKLQPTGPRGYALRVAGGVVYPVLLLYFFNRAHVRHAFREGLAPGGGGM